MCDSSLEGVTATYLDNFKLDLVLFVTAHNLGGNRQAADIRSRMHDALDAYLDRYALLVKAMEDDNDGDN